MKNQARSLICLPLHAAQSNGSGSWLSPKHSACKAAWDCQLWFNAAMTWKQRHALALVQRRNISSY